LIGAPRWEATLWRHAEIVRAGSGIRARSYAGQRFSLVIVDAASMYTSGERICRDLSARFPNAKLILITASSAVERPTHADIAFDTTLTARQLTGAVSRLLRADSHETLNCGPFSLNRTARILQAYGKSIPLSPKLADLIALFMSHPNQNLPRAYIMQRVWNTAYLGDTRTLNVHIRHARMVLETDPQKPDYLKTVRRKDYRLETAIKKKSRQPLPDSVQCQDE
jgi:DNA-binding response OmpR family regulator